MASDGEKTRQALTGTNTDEIKKGLEHYLRDKRIDSLFTGMTENLLLFQPDNPIRFLQTHLKDNYPSASLPLETSPSDLNRKNRILIKETVSSDEDLSEDEDISTFETEDSSTTTTRQDGYVRQLKGMPMFNPTLRRHAVSAPCLYKMKKKNNASARAVITGCFGSGQQRGLMVDTKKDDEEEENDQKKESKQTKDEEEVVIQQQLSDVIQEREASQMFFRFMSKHDKRVANRSLRFLLELERLEKKMKSLNSKKLEERVTDMLNEYIIRGSERMLDLTDPERREISNLVRSSPGLSNFDIARDKVIRQLLHKMHRPGKKALSLFGLWLEHVREVEGMNISEGGDDDDEEELPLPDVDTKSLQRVLKRHPLFSSLPESVLTSLVTKFELRTLNRHETLIKNLDKTEMKKQKKNDIKNIRYDEMYVVASGKFEVYLELSPEESRLEVLRQRKKREDGASDILKRIVRKRKGATTSNNDELSGMKSSSVLKRILGHVDLTKFRWYGWAGPTETIRAVAVLHDARPNVWVRASPEERSRVWAIRREHVREVLRHGMSKHRDWIVSKLRDASPKVLGILERNEIDSFADSVRVEVYKDNERVLACGTNSKRFLVVLSGKLEIRQNDETVLCELHPGHCFGESSLLIPGKSSDVDIISVISNTKCLVLTRKSIECVVGPLLSMLKSRDMNVYRRTVVSLVRLMMLVLRVVSDDLLFTTSITTTTTTTTTTTNH